jgi:hypothetical protein
MLYLFLLQDHLYNDDDDDDDGDDGDARNDERLNSPIVKYYFLISTGDEGRA